MNRRDSAVIIQARMTSRRFPGKMLMNLGGVPLIEYVYRRCQESGIADVLVATSDDASDDVLYDYCGKHDIRAVRGSLDNVLERYIQAAEFIGARYVIRVSGDTPFVDISLADILLKALVNEGLDYVSLNRETCAAGFYSEAVTLHSLKKTARLTNVKEDVEHVTKFIVDAKDKFSMRFMDVNLNPEFLKDARLTIDYPSDMQRANAIVDELPDRLSFTSREILDIVRRKGLK